MDIASICVVPIHSGVYVSKLASSKPHRQWGPDLVLCCADCAALSQLQVSTQWPKELEAKQSRLAAVQATLNNGINTEVRPGQAFTRPEMPLQVGSFLHLQDNRPPDRRLPALWGYARHEVCSSANHRWYCAARLTFSTLCSRIGQQRLLFQKSSLKPQEEAVQ
jgi:hypothetical protein